jgi:hypothetical protein
MICVSADNVSASDAKVNLPTNTIVKHEQLTCLTKQLADPPWCTYSHANLCPFKICNMLFELEVLREELRHLATLLTT